MNVKQITSSSILNQKGFTLIELMMVVAIIGILSAIAISNYQSYVLKSKISVAYHEINSLRMPYDTLTNGGAGVSEYTLIGLNMTTLSKVCNFVITPYTGTGDVNNAIRCNFDGIPTLQGKFISLTKKQTGDWVCHIDVTIPSKYHPKGCPN